MNGRLLQRKLCSLSNMRYSSLLLGGVSVVNAFTFLPGTNNNNNSVQMLQMSTSATSTTTIDPALVTIQKRLVNSWISQLSPESKENYARSLARERLDDNDIDPTVNNARKRPVFNGHYVLTKPTGIANPRLVLYSNSVVKDLLRLSSTPDSIAENEDFVRWVSGNLPQMGPSWATGYALSIMGNRDYVSNCPYGTGDGYGDGRAQSIGEISVDNGKSYELQLKGAGPTPYCRGADGRAVLRSSIREFLASEAMHHLNISTTRALSLVVSQTDRIQRPWYRPDSILQLPTLEDPRLQSYPIEQRREIIQQLKARNKADPNILVSEPAAITCRVSPSFARVGHVDLFARRAEAASMRSNANKRYDTTTNEWKELTELIWHVCYREFKEEAYDPFIDSNDIASAATVLLEKSAENMAEMVADWIRVGFVQGNFNADNCLIGGRTMDYGPFGFINEYIPEWAAWTGSGTHFGFINQPQAGMANYGVLVASVIPVIAAEKMDNKGDVDVEKVANPFLENAVKLFQSQVDETFRLKLGFERDQDLGDDVWLALEPLMRKSRTDWTVFFRQLTYVVRDFSDPSSNDYAGMLKVLEGNESEREGSSPFYEPLSEESRKEWLTWIDQWRTSLVASRYSLDAVYEDMRTTNPKYILREFMLVEAYEGAAKNEEAELFYLMDLIQRPYDEGSQHEEQKYYRRAPDEALVTGGTAFMS